MDKKDPNDLIVRQSLHDAYNKQCAYCTEHVDYSNLQVDHVIPQHLIKKQSQLERIIEDYGMPKDFEIDSFENFLPSCTTCNNKYKSGKIRDKNQWYHWYYDVILHHLPKVKALEEKYRKQEEKSKCIKETTRFITNGSIQPNEIISTVFKMENILTVKNIMDLLNKINGDDTELIETLTPEENIFILKALNELKSMLRDKFNIISKKMLDNNEIGIGISQNSNNISYCIYTLPNCITNKSIIEFSHNKWRDLKELGNQSFSNHFHGTKKDVLLSNTPENVAITIFSELYEDFINQKKLQHFNKEIATECLFFLMDRWYSSMIRKDVPPKDTYTLDEIDTLFKQTFEDPIHNYTTFSNGYSSYHICLSIFDEIIQYLKSINITIIERLYKKPSLQINRSHYQWEKYTSEDTIYNIKFVYSNLPLAYNDVMSSNFPLIKNEIKPFYGANIIVINIKEKKVSDSWGILKIFYLESNESSIKTHFVDENQFLYDDKKRILTFNGKEYSVLCKENRDINSIEETYLMMLVYKEIIKSIDSYLSIKDSFRSFCRNWDFRDTKNFWK